MQLKTSNPKQVLLIINNTLTYFLWFSIFQSCQNDRVYFCYNLSLIFDRHYHKPNLVHVHILNLWYYIKVVSYCNASRKVNSCSMIYLWRMSNGCMACHDFKILPFIRFCYNRKR